MSSIKRGVRKTFRGVKKVAKKIAKPALIAGAIYFTAGMASGAFATAGAGAGPMAFLKSVGQTIQNGASNVVNALGFGAVEEGAKRGGLGGLLSRATKAFGGLSDPVQAALLSGAASAFKGVEERKEARRLERRADETGLFGVRRRGSEGVIGGDFGEAVRQGFGLAQAPAPTSGGLLDPIIATPPTPVEEEEEMGALAGGFGLERGLLAQSQANMPQFI